MLDLVLGLPGQLEEGARLAGKVALGRPARFDRVVIAGMGGSGIGGNLCRGLLQDESEVPLLLCQDYDLPKTVTASSLFLAISYSGNTEETLSAFGHARRRGCRIIAVTTGGELGRQALLDGNPVVALPPGMPPRAALGYLFSAQLVLLARMGIGAEPRRKIAETARFLKRRTRAWRRKAKLVARQLAGRLPLVYSTSRLLDAVADRWRCQFNENAGVMCHTSQFSEHNHNEIVGMGNPGYLARRSVVVALLGPETHTRNRMRLGYMLKIARAGYAGALQLESQGKSRLAHMLSLVMLGDLVSVELAGLVGKDPMEIKRIDMLKRLMTGSRR